MTARLRVSQLLVLAAIFAVAPVTAAAAATADPVESNVDSASDAVSANERNLQFYAPTFAFGNSPSGSCEAIYMRAFSSESAGFFENLCTLSGLVAYKLGDVNTISQFNRVVPMAAGSGLTSALSFRGDEFTTDLGTLGFANLAKYCSCKALQAGCDPIADCVRGGDAGDSAGLGSGRYWGRDLHKQNLEYIRDQFSRDPAANQIDTTRQARALLDYTRGIPTDKCLSLCTNTPTPQ